MGSRSRVQPLPLLPVGNRGACLRTSVHELGEHLQAAYREFEHLSPVYPGHSFRHRSNVVALGSAQLCVSAHDAVVKRVAEQLEPTLVLPFQGELRVEVAGLSLRAQAGKRALLLSGARMKGQTGLFSGIRLNLNRHRLQRVARDMTGGRAVDLQLDLDRELELMAIPSGHGIPSLSSLLVEIGRAAERPELVPLLGLDDLLERWVVALLAPAVLRDHLGVPATPPPGKAALDKVCDYVRANLERPIRLSDLESVSGLSRRALQYAFRRHLDCTPLQWVAGNG